MNNLQTRLDQILERIDSSDFLSNEGLGNEIGFWIFDYPAENELIVRDYIDYLTEKLTKRNKNFKVLNVFELLLDMLESRNLLQRAFDREKQVGSEALRNTLKAPLSQKKIAQYIQQNNDLSSYDFILITGLGSAWPLVRGNELLSAFQDVMGHTPLVLFYPGEYSGLDLHLFGKIESQNYYRAFKLVP